MSAPKLSSIHGYRTVGMILLPLLASPASAQKYTTPSSADPSPLSHDVAANDPSPKPQLELEAVIQQKRYARTQFFRGIFLGEYFKQGAQRLFHTRYRKLLRRNPGWFERLRLHADRYTPSAPNSPALINTDWEFEGISKRDYGYCWGFVTLFRNFAVLAFFDPSERPMDDEGRVLSPSVDREKWVEYYERKIEEVAIYGYATVIPGFADLREMSLVPELELYMKLKTMALWRSYAIRPSGLGVMLRSRKDLTAAGTEALIDDLEERLARHEMPKLMITSLARVRGLVKVSKYLHVVLTYGMERLPGGGARLRIWDPNFYGETLAKTPKEIRIEADGRIYYEPWAETATGIAPISNRLARVELAPENDGETVDQLFELRRFCNDDESARYCR